MKIHKLKVTKPQLQNFTSWIFVCVIAVFIGTVLMVSHARATTSGQMRLYFHKEGSDASENYNALSLTPPEPAADTAPPTTTSVNTVTATPPTAFCQAADGATDANNERIASAASTGNRCLSTFISMPVGNAISMSTGDTNSITSQLWSSESANQAAVALNVYLYRCTTTCISTNALTSTDRIATLTCAEPGTAATSCSVTATPANNITFAATDRIVAVVTSNVTNSRNGASTAFYFDSSARTASSVTLKYTALAYNTTNKPSLTGPMDDDFTTAAATTACSTSGVPYNTKWNCLQGTAASTAGSFNAQDTSAAGSGDSSSWLWLRNQTTATTASPDDFIGGVAPSNTFLYQTMPAAYGDGNIRTVVNSSATYQVASFSPLSPYNHSGLVLWTSNTDFLELEVFSNGATTTTSDIGIALNNSGVLGTPTYLNTTLTSGIYSTVWLGFNNSGGTWQAQYSTDGTTWNNVGSAVSHTTNFSRVGLNAFTAIANPVSSYAGAFEWFSYGLASPTYSQTSYRWFANADSTTPGSALAAQNTAYTLTSAGQQFRLRQLIKMTGQQSLSGQNFALQYGQLSTTCSAISIGSWDYVSQPSLGPNNAFSAVDDSSNGGNLTWNNPANAQGDADGSFASPPSSTASGQVSDYLKLTNFGFSIPSTATVTGIKVEFNRQSSGAVRVTDSAVRIIKGGVIGSTDRSGTTWSITGFTWDPYGGSTDLWGQTFTYSDINSSSFGVAIAANETWNNLSGGSQAQIDAVRITVYYTTNPNIAYYDNPTPASASNISSTVNDPTDTGQTVNPQTYQESEPFTNSQTVYGNTVDAEWDFSLHDNGAPAGTTYCFRTVKSDGTVLDSYVNYPMITTYTAAVTPTTDQLLRGGEWFSSGSKQTFFWTN